MSDNLNKQAKNKRTIVVEDLENGAVRITVASPPYPAQSNNDHPTNLLTCDIDRVGLSDPNGKVKDRERHTRDVCQAVLWALQYGTVVDLRFWTELDTLPNGQPRCDHRFFAIDEEGESDSARCTNEATTKVRVTELRPEGRVFDAKLCDACAERESKDLYIEPKPLRYGHKVEVIEKIIGKKRSEH